MGVYVPPPSREDFHTAFWRSRIEQVQDRMRREAEERRRLAEQTEKEN